MCCFYQTSNTINLVSATKYTAFWVIEYCIFMKDLVDCSATTHGVIFTEDIVKIAGQQGQDAVGRGLSLLGIECGLRYLDPGTAILARRGYASPHGD
jgi:hypothetical protein